MVNSLCSFSPSPLEESSTQLWPGQALLSSLWYQLPTLATLLPYSSTHLLPLFLPPPSIAAPTTKDLPAPPLCPCVAAHKVSAPPVFADFKARLLGPSESQHCLGLSAYSKSQGFAPWLQRAGSRPTGTWGIKWLRWGLSRTACQCKTKAQLGLAQDTSLLSLSPAPKCLPSPGPAPGPPTCSFQRKSRRAVDSTCWACRYRASTKTEMMMGVTTFNATLVACSGLRVGGGQA